MGTLRRSPDGYISIATMIFLVVGMVLAAALATTVVSSTATSANELSRSRALLAAQSGLNYARYRLDRASISPSPLPDRGTIVSTLRTRLANSGVSLLEDGASVSFSAIELADKSSFAIQFSPNPSGSAFEYTLSVEGRHGHARKVIGVHMNTVEKKGYSALNYGMAAKGGLSISNNAGIYQAYDSDDRTYDTDDEGTEAAISVPGYPAAEVLKFADSPPTEDRDYYFPTAAARLYELLDVYARAARADQPSGPLQVAQVGNDGRTSDSNWTNVVIRPNGGQDRAIEVIPPPSLNGIIYVEWPNILRISSDTEVNGTIIYAKPSGATQPGQSAFNIDARVFYTHRPATESQLNSVFGEDLADVRSSLLIDRGDDPSAGWCIIAPDAAVDIANGTDKRDGVRTHKTFYGSISAYVLDMTGAGNAQPQDVIIYDGCMLTETQIRIGGNRVFCINPPYRGDDLYTTMGFGLDMTWQNYWEQ